MTSIFGKNLLHSFWSPFSAITVATFLLVMPDMASAKVHFSERTKYYMVTGTNGAKVARSMLQKGPKAGATGHAIATTLTRVRVRNLKAAIQGRRCVVKSVDVFVDLTYTFPRWVSAKKASPSVRRAWEQFYKQVERHEFVHGRISRDFGRDLHKKLLQLSGRVSNKCADFGKRQAKRINQMRTEYIKRQYRFDRREARASARVRRLQRVFLRSQ
ncbi:MAG: DUF922 domain-containing protein [Pseudomonadota bacterium]